MTSPKLVYPSGERLQGFYQIPKGVPDPPKGKGGQPWSKAETLNLGEHAQPDHQGLPIFMGLTDLSTSGRSLSRSFPYVPAPPAPRCHRLTDAEERV